MHDGLKGRKHVYSYVHYDDAWWKIVDHAVTKVRSPPSSFIPASKPAYHVLSVGGIGDGPGRQVWNASRSGAFPPYLQSFAARAACKRMARHHQG